MYAGRHVDHGVELRGQPVVFVPGEPRARQGHIADHNPHALVEIRTVERVAIERGEEARSPLLHRAGPHQAAHRRVGPVQQGSQDEGPEEPGRPGDEYVLGNPVAGAARGYVQLERRETLQVAGADRDRHALRARAAHEDITSRTARV